LIVEGAFVYELYKLIAFATSEFFKASSEKDLIQAKRAAVPMVVTMTAKRARIHIVLQEKQHIILILQLKIIAI